MAKLLSHTASEIRGRVGGLLYTTNPSGHILTVPYRRHRPTQSNAQIASTSSLSKAIARFNRLTPAQLAIWKAFYHVENPFRKFIAKYSTLCRYHALGFLSAAASVNCQLPSNYTRITSVKCLWQSKPLRKVRVDVYANFTVNIDVICECSRPIPRWRKQRLSDFNHCQRITDDMTSYYQFFFIVPSTDRKYWFRVRSLQTRTGSRQQLSDWFYVLLKP